MAAYPGPIPPPGGEQGPVEGDPGMPSFCKGVAVTTWLSGCHHFESVGRTGTKINRIFCDFQQRMRLDRGVGAAEKRPPGLSRQRPPPPQTREVPLRGRSRLPCLTAVNAHRLAWNPGKSRPPVGGTPARQIGCGGGWLPDAPTGIRTEGGSREPCTGADQRHPRHHPRPPVPVPPAEAGGRHRSRLKPARPTAPCRDLSRSP